MESDGTVHERRQTAAADHAVVRSRRNRLEGIQPTQQTLGAVDAYVHFEEARRTHRDTPVPDEDGLGLDVAVVRDGVAECDETEQQTWLRMFAEETPEGMNLTVERLPDGRMTLTLEGPSTSVTECCGAQMFCMKPTPQSEGPHGHMNTALGCEECGARVEPHTFAHYVTTKKGSASDPRLTMPSEQAFIDHAVRDRKLMNAVFLADAMVDVNKRLDEFEWLEGSDDVIVGDLPDADMFEDGENGIQECETDADISPEMTTIRGWTVLDTYEGKQIHYSSPRHVPDTSAFEQCRIPPPTGIRLP